MNIIEQIKAEIDKRYAEYREKMKTDDFTYYEGMADALDLFEQFIDTLESEKPTNPEDAMKELNEKIALVKQRGTWDGVDVDKYMDEVRGREPEKPTQEGLEEEIEEMVNERATKSGTTKSEMDFYRNGIKDAIKRFGLRPSWKPSEGHLSALLAVFNDPNNIGSQTCQLALTDLYKKLKKL